MLQGRAPRLIEAVNEPAFTTNTQHSNWITIKSVSQVSNICVYIEAEIACNMSINKTKPALVIGKLLLSD